MAVTFQDNSLGWAAYYGGVTINERRLVRGLGFKLPSLPLGNSVYKKPRCRRQCGRYLARRRTILELSQSADMADIPQVAGLRV